VCVLDLCYDNEDGGSTFLRNVGKISVRLQSMTSRMSSLRELHSVGQFVNGMCEPDIAASLSALVVLLCHLISA
jgi:hypothetical protein